MLKMQQALKKIIIPMNQVLTIKTMKILNYLLIKREQIKAQRNHPKIQMLLKERAREVKL
jgi:hypothetical protein